MRIRIAALCAAALAPFTCAAQTDDSIENSKSLTTLREVLVTGEYPGPGVWKVMNRSAEGEHVLWIVGSPPLVTAGLTWRSQQLEIIASQAEEVLLDSSFSIVVPANGFGIFRTITILPAILSARKNPNEQRLQEILPSDLYARWLVQKNHYIGRDQGIERWRPMFAAEELRNKVSKELGFGMPSGDWAVRKLAKERGIKMTAPMIIVTVPLKGLRTTIKAFSRESVDDIDCLAATIAFAEMLSNRDASNARIHSWATGDLHALRNLQPLANPKSACQAALIRSQAAVQFGFDDVPQRLNSIWLDAAVRSLEANQVTLAVMPIAELLSPDGRLASLRTKGYLVVEP